LGIPNPELRTLVAPAWHVSRFTRRGPENVHERTVSRANEHLRDSSFLSARRYPIHDEQRSVWINMFQPNGAPSTDDEILTVMDVARFLITQSPWYKLARVGELPASKLGSIGAFSVANP